MSYSDNESANAYPWNFTWVRRKYHLVSASQIENIREFLDEEISEKIDADPELKTWKYPLEDQYYIFPDITSPVEYYSLADKINDVDYPIISNLPHTDLAAIDLNNPKAILDFVNTYGLLGVGDLLVHKITLGIHTELDQSVIQEIITLKGIESANDREILECINRNRVMYDDGDEASYECFLIKNCDAVSIAPQAQIRDLFFPMLRDLEMARLPMLKTSILNINSKTPKQLLAGWQIKNNDFLAMSPYKVIWDHYSEPLNIFISYARQFQKLYKHLSKIEHSAREILEIETMFRENLLNINSYPEYDWKSQIWLRGWQIGTLLDACYLMLYLDITGGRKARFCEKCNTPFIATRNHKRFCSTKCEQRAKQKKYREKQNNKETKNF